MEANYHQSILVLDVTTKNGDDDVLLKSRGSLKIVNRNKSIPAFKNNLYKLRNVSQRKEELNGDLIIVN